MAKRTFKIYRYDPDKDAKPYMQTIDVELDGHERMLLDALMKLKAVDPSISFRRSCREGVCGSDAMNINGRNGLACVTNIRSLPNTVVLKPLPGLPVIREVWRAERESWKCDLDAGNAQIELFSFPAPPPRPSGRVPAPAAEESKGQGGGLAPLRARPGKTALSNRKLRRYTRHIARSVYPSEPRPYDRSTRPGIGDNPTH